MVVGRTQKSGQSVGGADEEKAGEENAEENLAEIPVRGTQHLAADDQEMVKQQEQQNDHEMVQH